MRCAYLLRWWRSPDRRHLTVCTSRPSWDSRQANTFRRSRPPRPCRRWHAGADEIDMVIDVGAAVSGEFDAVRADIAAVRAAVPDAVLKVIVESAALLSLAGEDALTVGVPGGRRRGRRLRQDLHRVSSQRRRVGARGRADGRRRRRGSSGSRPAAASAPPTTPSRCWTRAPPGWGCREPAPCSTVWSKGHAGRAGSQPREAGVVVAGRDLTRSWSKSALSHRYR